MRRPRVFSKDDGLESGDLLHSAEDHLSAAKALFAGDPAHFDSAGYLAHMGFELMFKSWLLEADGSFEGIHSLMALYELLHERHGAPELCEAEKNLLHTLDEFESLRYPNRKNPTEVGTEDWERATEFMNKVRSLLPNTIHRSNEGDDLVRKGGRVLMRKPIGAKD